MAESDRGYKLLFSHPELVADLLRGFVPEPWVATPEQRSLRRAFGIWLRRAFLRRRRPGAVIPEIDDLREVKAMLAERWEQWTREWEQRGVQQGLRRSRGRPAPGALAHRPEPAGRDRR